MTPKPKVRYSVRISWGGWGMDGAVYEKILGGYAETYAVSEAQAINNVRFRSNIPTYPVELGQGNTLEHTLEARIMKPGETHEETWRDIE